MWDKPSRPIKVMHIIARMNVGGPAVEITELMRGLDPELVSQCLVTGYCDEDEADFLDTQATDIEAIRIKGLGRSLRPTEDLRAFFELVKLIRQSQPDVVHTHTAKAGVLGRIAARVSGTRCKVVHTYHGHLLNGYFGRRTAYLVLLAERILSLLTDRLITVGEQVRDDLVQAHIGTEQKYVVVHSGVSDKPYLNGRSLREFLGIPEDAVVVLFLGRITNIKRPDRFARVVQLILERNCTVHFLVVGDGELRPVLEDSLQVFGEQVHFLGWVGGVRRVISASDILLITSDNEGLPITILEAALGAVPTVATDVGAIREVIASGITGILCEPSADALADAITDLCRFPVMRRQIGLAAQARVREQYSLELFLSKHRSIYESLRIQ